jgi:hypothetical protein
MTEFTDDAKSGYLDHILKSIVERASVIVEARMSADPHADFSYPVLAELMVAAELRELGLEVSHLTAEMERLAAAVERK